MAVEPQTSRDTIFALSSGRPPAAIAIVRISGPDCAAVLDRIGSDPRPRTAMLRALRDERDELLDRALLLWFPGPASATGEDLLELHLHGGRAVVAAVTGWLARMGLREAQPGEFTRRALFSGRLDLSEVEGLADLLAAETESQRRDAILRADGALGRQLSDWTGRLVAIAAKLEAAIDYDGSDEVRPDNDRYKADVARLRSEMEAALSRPPAERLRDGIRVAILGPVNAGKSTLFNALLGRDAAIVSPIAGTTRDVNEASVAISGIPFVLSDTAGLRDTSEPVEQLGINRAHAAADNADIMIDFRPEATCSPRCIAVTGKADVNGSVIGRLPISGRTGEGISLLLDRLVQRGRGLLPGEGEVALTLRHRSAVGADERALADCLSEPDPLLQAEHVGGARRALDAVTGTCDLDAVLDAVFSRFCLGK